MLAELGEMRRGDMWQTQVTIQTRSSSPALPCLVLSMVHMIFHLDIMNLGISHLCGGARTEDQSKEILYHAYTYQMNIYGKKM